MNSLDLNDLVAATGNLATLPSTVVELLKILGDPTASAARVQKVLERDPAMTANVLKISNSAFYGVRRDISSVRDALVMLGNRRTATLAFATGMAPILRCDLKGYGITRDQFWSHSLQSAACSSEAAMRLGIAELQCEAFTAGLIHDVGMLVLDPVLTSARHSLDTEAYPDGLCHLEQELFGFDHCQAGALLAENWGFPEMLIEPIAWHHDPHHKGEYYQLIRAVSAGNLVTQVLDTDLEGDRLDLVEQTLAELGLESEFLEKLRLDLTSNLGEICDAATSLVPVRN